MDRSSVDAIREELALLRASLLDDELTLTGDDLGAWVGAALSGRWRQLIASRHRPKLPHRPLRLPRSALSSLHMMLCSSPTRLDLYARSSRSLRHQRHPLQSS